MALHISANSARFTLAIGLSALLASCSTGHKPSAMAIAPEVSKSSRFDASAQHVNYGGTTAVPRVYIDEGQIEEDAPDAYTVVTGDTLWDISDRFLKEPWRWTEIWGYNPQVYNPHLIYPGDVLALDYVNGRPTLSLTREGVRIEPGAGEPYLGAAEPGAGKLPRVKLEPKIRSESLDDAIPMISGNAISQFLVYPRVETEAVTRNAPYIIANDDGRLISAIGNRIYVRGTLNRNQTSYGVFRRNKVLIDPVNGANLGVEMMHVADAKLLSVGDPSTLGITSNKMETISGDVLLPINADTATHQYIPRMPELRGEARIVSLVNAIAKTGRNQVVVLNVGQSANIQEGDVLAVETRGTSVVDKRGAHAWESVKLPNQRTGVLMVFKTFDKVSYALVMESTRPITVNDIVTGI